jgi:ferredoxin-type protein NapH
LLLAALLSGSMIWEAVNPVTLTQRALIFGGTLAFAFPLAVFVFDFAVAPRGWCGHLCPMGACYSLLGKVSLLRVSAARRAACNDCMDCYAVCPEPQVISPALRGKGAATPLILSGTCSNCARCIDVCRQNVFRLTLRFDHRSES